MIVCHCQRVTDRQIRAAVRAGACSHREVAKSCAAGGRCGGCAPAIAEILDAEREKSFQAAPALAELAATG